MMNRRLNNSDFDVIDERIVSLRGGGPNPAVESRIGQRMRRHWQSLEHRPRSIDAWLHWLRSAPVRAAGACAVAVGAVCVAWLFIAYTTATSQTVYAQVLAAVREAKTIHAKGTKLKDGEVIDVVEIWCDTERGIRENFGQSDFRLDNGEFEWIYRSDGDFVIKGPSRDPMGKIERILDPVKSVDFFGAKPDPTLDAKIDQVECRALVGTSLADRVVFWLDDRGRLIRFEGQRNTNATWTVHERIEMRYDAPIANELLVATIPPDARLIDRTAGLDEFATAQSLATAERLGIVLSIHDVRRVDDDTVFVMSTSRPSEEVINRVGRLKLRQGGANTYGEFVWASNGRRLADGSWREGLRPLVVASWVHDGVDYRWVLLRNAKSLLNDEKKLAVGFHVSAHNEWEAALQADQQPTHLRNVRDVLALDVPAKREGLEVVLAHIQAQTLTMGDASPDGAPSLHLRSAPYSDKDIIDAVVQGIPRDEAEKLLHRRSSQPQDISLEAWLSEVRAMLAE
jgi:hypothetical protein